ncbi:MAG: hypothetical protein ACRBN8_35395 [Nannocystales bacterium]
MALTACRVDADGDYDSLSAGGVTEGESAGESSTGGASASASGSGGTGGLSDTDVFPPSEDACEFEFGANPSGGAPVALTPA